MLHEIAATRSGELLTLAALLMALATAWLTDSMGLSVALGAFPGRTMLGDIGFRHPLEAEIRPFRDMPLGMFLVAMGVLLDVHALADVWPWVVLLTLDGLVSKGAWSRGSRDSRERTARWRCVPTSW